MKFEWDKNKNRSNIDKHKMDFNFASSVFNDTERIEWKDKRKNYDEQRFITISKIINAKITVIYTMRDNNIRIISARPAKKQERYLYNNAN